MKKDINRGKTFIQKDSGQSDSHVGKMVMYGLFVMKSAIRHSYMEDYKSIFENYRNNLLIKIEMMKEGF